MNYININKKRLVGRNNQQLTNQIIIDYSTIEDISFQLINDQNQIQGISDPSGLYLAGSIGIGKQSYELLFLSKDYTITPENIIVFSLDTYTTNYLNYIKKKNTEINIEIGQESLNTKKVILRDYALACPRVYVSGLSPQEIESKNFYTKTEVDELFSDLFIPTKVSQLENDSGFISGYTETDPIYTADKPSIALKSELFSGSYNDLTDKPSIPSKTSDLTNDSGFISGYTETDPIYTADKPSIALKNEIPTKVSELDNDSGFISGYTETDPVYSATSGQFQLKSEAFDGDYNSLTNKPSIPSKTSELQNDSGFISGYTETDPVYSATSGQFQLKEDAFSGSYNDLTDKPSIPSKTSDLTNDSGFISGYTETDPIYSAQSGQFELKSEAFSGSYNDLTDIPSGITLQGNTFNEAGQLVQLNEEGKIPSGLYDAGGGGGEAAYDNPLKFTSGQDGTYVVLLKTGSPPDISCFYNKNDTGWEAYTIGTYIYIQKGEYVKFKCTTSTFSTYAGDVDRWGEITNQKYYRFTGTGTFYVSGDITSLINYKSFTDYCFCWLFASCSALQTPPDLPYMDLTTGCYAYMFNGCSNLKYLPELPARILPAKCYQYMFKGCNGLIRQNFRFPDYMYIVTGQPLLGMFESSNVREVEILLISKVSGAMNDMFYSNIGLTKLRYNLDDDETISDWMAGGYTPLFILNGTHGNITRSSSAVPSSSPVMTQWWHGQDNYNEAKVYDGVVLSKKTLSSSNYLFPTNTYVWYVNVSTDSFTLNAVAEPNLYICYADLIVDLAADTSVTQGTNVSIVDSLTSGKRNLCKVKWIQGTAYIFVEKVMDLPV